MNQNRLKQVDLWSADWHKKIKEKIKKLEEKHSIKRLAKYRCMDTIINYNDNMDLIHRIVVPEIVDHLKYIKTHNKRKFFDDILNHKYMMLVGYKYKQIIKTILYEIIAREEMDPNNIFPFSLY